MTLPTWVSVALWFDFGCCVLHAVLSMARPGKPRAPFPSGAWVVLYVALQAWVALALWRVLRP